MSGLLCKCVNVQLHDMKEKKQQHWSLGNLCTVSITHATRQIHHLDDSREM